MGFIKKIRLRNGCMPTKFSCQPVKDIKIIQSNQKITQEMYIQEHYLDIKQEKEESPEIHSPIFTNNFIMPNPANHTMFVQDFKHEINGSPIIQHSPIFTNNLTMSNPANQKHSIFVNNFIKRRLEKQKSTHVNINPEKDNPQAFTSNVMRKNSEKLNPIVKTRSQKRNPPMFINVIKMNVLQGQNILSIETVTIKNSKGAGSGQIYNKYLFVHTYLPRYLNYQGT